MNNYSDILSEENYELLRRHLLFSGLSDAEITGFITRTDPGFIELEPHETFTPDPGGSRRLGVVLSGSVKVYTIDYDGNKTVINAVAGQGTVGTMQFMMEHYNMLFELIADEASKLLMLTPGSLLISDGEILAAQHKILVNLMASQRQLFLGLSEHLVCLSQKNIRDKIMRYLRSRSEYERSYEFEIPFSREELASYLAVDRASLSRSLSELKKEGIIDFQRNRFKILTTKHFRY